MNRVSIKLSPKKVAISLLALVLLLITGTVLTMVIVRKQYQKVQDTSVKATIDIANPVITQNQQSIKEPENISYELLEGWNFVSFPFEPLSFKTAAGLINDVVSHGGFVSTVSRWDGERWQEYTHNGNKQYGLDFPIEPGKGYFIRSHEVYRWSVYGLKLDDAQRIELSKGWNAIGFTSHHNHTAENVLDLIGQGKDIAQEIDWWQSGSWDVFVKRIYGQDNIQTYGNNFQIETTKGYMINSTEEITVRMEK